MAVTEPTTQRRHTAFWQVLVVFVLLTFLASLTGGLFGPGAWYAGLAKPSWNPPNWVFAPVWTILYIMIAVSGTLAWQAGASARVIGLWGAQMALNALWTVLFFALQRPGWALIEIAFMWSAIALYARAVWPIERRSTWLMLPYLAWVSFAAALNAALWWLNR